MNDALRIITLIITTLSGTTYEVEVSSYIRPARVDPSGREWAAGRRGTTKAILYRNGTIIGCLRNQNDWTDADDLRTSVDRYVTVGEPVEFFVESVSGHLRTSPVTTVSRVRGERPSAMAA